VLKAILAEVRRRFRVDRKGAAAIEYAMLGALIAVVAVTAVTSFGTNLRAQFELVATSF
jgi:pilus assembly protein Flp/PilA